MGCFLLFVRPFTKWELNFIAFTDEVVFLLSVVLIFFYVDTRLSAKTNSGIAFTIIGLYVLGMIKNISFIVREQILNIAAARRIKKAKAAADKAASSTVQHV